MHFVSLINPFLIQNLKFLDTHTVNNKARKIFLKQSYLILTWFYYFNLFTLHTGEKNKIKIFTSLKKKYKFTLTKAPIAHKNWSKEQYKFEFFNFNVSIKSFLDDDKKMYLKSINESLIFLLIAKKNCPATETNLFFLKTTKIFLDFQDFFYFNYTTQIR